MRLAYYAGASTAAAAACLLKAFHERPNFYSATVYLSQSNACLLIITNLLLVLACSMMYALQRLLYGPLRPIEIEQLSEKAWYAVLDTLLAMPSFREDVGGWLLAMFVLLLAGKVWGWIGEGKVDVLEQQPPANPKLFHARLATSLTLSVVFDLYMLDYCSMTVLADPRPGMMVIFTFEFAILSVQSFFTLARYLLSVVQSRIERAQTKRAIDERKNEIRAERAAAAAREAGGPTAEMTTSVASTTEEPIIVDENEIDVPGWEEKRRYLFGLEVLTDFIKLLMYICFFTVSITFNGLPMHIMRDVYMTAASFSKRISDYVAYRKATSEMNTRYPDATTEEIQGDACIVCRESMTAWETAPATGVPQGQAQQAGGEQAAQAAPVPNASRRRDEGLRAKKLPCGHILHLRCLKAWLERQQVCPTCRRPVVPPRDGNAAQANQQGGAARGAVNGAVPPGQQGQAPTQQAPRRAGRARILNLGPIRIGFLNGPGDQIGNLLRHMENPQAAQGAVQDPNQAANQQGPNHLGLQVPYLPGSSVNTSNMDPTTQIQIAQLEQRLLHEVQSLSLEQQQLANLRAMEQEAARLRALHQATQQRNGVPQPPHPAQPPQQPSPFSRGPTLGYTPPYPTMPFQNPYIPMPTPTTAFQSAAGQTYTNGHESLPQGMVLPEGWTVMPLQRVGPAPAPQVQSDHPAEAPSLSNSNITAPEPNASAADVGPTDDTGSPLFVPSASAPSESTSQPAQPTTHPTDSKLSSEPPHHPTQAELRTPWQSEGWSFVDPPNGAPVIGEEQHDATKGGESSSSTAEQSREQHVDKGKGKAVAVEDVPDPDTGV